MESCLRSDARVRAVRIPSGAVVWKEFDLAPNAIAVGDWVDVKGTPLYDGSLLAKSGWLFVNIGRRDGVVSTRNRRRRDHSRFQGRRDHARAVSAIDEDVPRAVDFRRRSR
jgi:hypothetical protein